jgi:hypothetical protein
MRQECDDYPQIDEDFEELSLAEIKGYLAMVESCTDCNGCDGLLCRLREAVTQKVGTEADETVEV